VGKNSGQRALQSLPAGSSKTSPATERSIATAGEKYKSRGGLPSDFQLHHNRFGRTRLLEGNIYQLSNGKEFVPCIPSGALGQSRHLYALLSVDQYEQGRRGSVYVRNDGRIFDYSQLGVDTDLEFFDTGFTINDLERTGRYVKTPALKKAGRMRKKPNEMVG